MRASSVTVFERFLNFRAMSELVMSEKVIEEPFKNSLEGKLCDEFP